MRPNSLVVCLVFAVVSLGCPTPVEPGPDSGLGGGAGATGGGQGGSGGGGGGGSPLPDGGVARSAKGNLRFKGDVRLGVDYGAALGLPVDQVCAELGLYQCTALVHTVALGGVDPYGKGVYEPQAVTGGTTPVVVERIALSACVKRVDLDLASPNSAIIFKSIPVSQGKLANPSGPEVRRALTELAQRAWLRNPSENEVAQLTDLNAAIEGKGGADSAKVWMQAACFAVLSSAESVFY